MKQFFNIAILALFSIFASCTSIDEPQFVDNPSNQDDYETFTMDIKMDSSNLANTRAHTFFDEDFYKSVIEDIDFSKSTGNTSPVIIAVKGENVYAQQIYTSFKINEVGLSLKNIEKDKISLSITYLKGNPPSDLKIYCVYGAFFSYSQYEALKGSQYLNCYCVSGSNYHPRINLYCGMVDFSDVTDWENINKQLVMKRPLSVVSILSDADDIEDVIVNNHTSYDPGYYDVQKTTMISPNTILPDFSSYRWQSKILAYASMRYDILTNKPYSTLISWDPRNEHWSGSSKNNYPNWNFEKKTIGGRAFTNVGEFQIFCSPEGEIPTVEFNDYTDSSFTEDNLPEKGKKIKYCVLTLWGNDHSASISSIYDFKIKHALIPLPEKMYPNRIYYIKNKPGTKFFGTPYSYQYDSRTPATKSSISNQTAVNIISPDDIEIESYDLKTMERAED